MNLLDSNFDIFFAVQINTKNHMNILALATTFWKISVRRNFRNHWWFCVGVRRRKKI